MQTFKELNKTCVSPADIEKIVGLKASNLAQIYCKRDRKQRKTLPKI